MLCPPDCNYVSVFGFPVYYYGIVLAVAVFVGTFVSHRVAVMRYGFINIIPSIAAYVIIGGIIGARLYYCLLNLSFYVANPLHFFAIREGGLSIHGAILGGGIVLYYCAKRNGIPFFKLCDILAVGLPIAQAIGRFGNFFNSEAFGLPTNLPWKMFVSEEYRPADYADYSYFHPAFLYESILNILIFLLLYYLVLPKYRENSGITAAVYLLLYSLIRIPLEFIRTDCSAYLFGIPIPVIISVLLIIISVLFILFKNSINILIKNR